VAGWSIVRCGHDDFYLYASVHGVQQFGSKLGDGRLCCSDFDRNALLGTEE